MSRMLGLVADRPMTFAEAVGDDLLATFLALSRLHGDGWGTAAGPPLRPASGLGRAADASSGISATVGTAGLLYLRFASAGSAVSAENLQPFTADGFAFAHNGALVPRDLGVDELSAAERLALRGTTDSEVYFALLRRSLREHDATEHGVVAGVARVRALYPTACLNAMLLIDGSLVVVHSRGSVAPPLEAFARRGFTGDALPAGHDDTYNLLSTAVLASGARVVATTGVDTSGWTPLENDTVHVFNADGTTRSARM